MKLSEIFIKAKALIDKPETWTQEAPCRDARGRALSAEAHNSEKAVCWCSAGALLKTVGYDEEEYEKARKSFNSFLGIHYITEFNDTNSHAVVMEGWNKAIELAQLAETPEGQKFFQADPSVTYTPIDAPAPTPPDCCAKL